MSPITFTLFCAISVTFGVNCLIRKTREDKPQDYTIPAIKALVNRVQVLEAIVQSHPGELEYLRRELLDRMKDQQLAHKTEMDKLRDDFQTKFSKIQTETRDKISSMQQKYIDEISQVRNSACPPIRLPEISKQSNESVKQEKDGKKRQMSPNTVNKIERNEINLKITDTRPKGISRNSRQSRGGVVAFFATSSRIVDHLGTNQNIIFDRVVTNVGNAYDVNHGIFRAPVSGVYVFSATVTVHNKDDTHFGFVRNTERLTTIGVHGSDNFGDHGSNTIVIHLNQGDDISVQHYDSDKGIYGDNHCMMSGFLLTEDGEASFVGK